MGELIIQLETSNPVEIFGINNTNVTLLKRHFPHLKIIARGSDLKVMGEPKELQAFEKVMNRLVEHFNKYHQLPKQEVELLLNGNGPNGKKAAKEDVLVYGGNGRLIRPRTQNQQLMVRLSEVNDLLLVVGPAGTGKTYTAVALAVRALKNKEVKRIILTRPAVEAGENLGFLPGDLNEKLDPYLQPLYDALRDMLPDDKLETHIHKGVVQIAPLAYMRGRTLDNAFVILDEAQNATRSQMKMFLTRMGESAKFIVTGDATQIDLPKKTQSGLMHAADLLKNVPGIGQVFLDERDVVRHRLVKKILSAYEKE